VLASFRNMGIVGASALWLGESVTAWQAAGYAITTVGFLVYQAARGGGGKGGAS
jgi:hypothetical protein